MTAATLDQVRAALAETRGMIHAALPDAANAEPIRDRRRMPPAVRQILDSLQTPATPRCKHLRRRPIQPWVAFAWEGIWRCRPCAKHHAQRHQQQLATRPRTLAQQIEDRTCDLCRTVAGPGQLTPLAIRDDVWLLIGAACPPCTGQVERHGGRLLTGGGRG